MSKVSVLSVMLGISVVANVVAGIFMCKYHNSIQREIEYSSEAWENYSRALAANDNLQMKIKRQEEAIQRLEDSTKLKSEYIDTQDRIINTLNKRIEIYEKNK